MAYKKSSTEEDELIIKQYQDGKTMLEIAKNINRTAPHVCRKLHQSGVKLRSINEAHSVYRVNESFFEKIDSHAKAQILGMIYADGCIIKKTENSKAFTLTLHEDDFYYLEWIKKQIEYTGPIRRWKSKKPGTEHHGVVGILAVRHIKFVNDLMHQGVGYRKSLTCEFPSLEQVPAEFVNSFILGYLEGDGSIYLKEYSDKRSPSFRFTFCVSEPFGVKLKQILKDIVGIESFFYKQKDSKIHVLAVGGNKQSIKLARYLYKDASFWMTRKKDIYDRIHKYYDQDGNFIETEDRKAARKKKLQAAIVGIKKSEEMKAKMRKLGSLRVPLLRVKSPNGQIYQVCGVEKFTEEVGGWARYFGHLRSGKIANYKGWTLATPAEIEAATTANTLIEKNYY